jgi:two-component system sensor histidine kinase MprB
MTLGRRLVLMTSLALGAVTVLVCAFSYVLVRHEVYARLDKSLVSRAAVLAPAAQRYVKQTSLPIVLTPGEWLQSIDTAGRTLRPPQQAAVLPATERERAVAARTRDPFFETVSVDGERARMFTAQIPGGVALEVARSLHDEDATLGRLRLVFVLLGAGGLVLSLLLGTWIAETALAPVRRLTHAATEIEATRNLALRLDEHGSDEVAQLSASFNAMLAALEHSVAAQRLLVADASHEFRTPITSMRANVELLARADDLDPAERREILRSVVDELDELAALVSDVIELARDPEAHVEHREVRLDEIVSTALDRTRRRAPHVRFEAQVQPFVLQGDPDALLRCVTNLLDNAAKWSPEGGVVEVELRGGELRVRDHGPGIAEDELPLVFERFYRTAAARSQPGSGLGLAIVRHVATAHGGKAEASAAEGGGAEFRVTFSGE